MLKAIDGKKLKDLLPIPKEVSEHVLISEHLNLKGGNLAGITKSGPTSDQLSVSTVTAESAWDSAGTLFA